MLQNDNHQLINSIRIGENKTFEYLYKEHFKLVGSLVLKNHGNEEDAKELFQDTLIALFKKVRDEPNFELNAQIGTYIYAIARNQWLKRLRTYKNNPIILVEDTTQFEAGVDEFDVDVHEVQYEQKHIIVKETLESLKKECKDIIEAAFFRKLSGLEIAQKLGYSEDFVKVKKFRCLKELKKTVFEHPYFKSKL